MYRQIDEDGMPWTILLGLTPSPIVLYCWNTQYLTRVFQERATITVLPGQGCARIGSAILRQGLLSSDLSSCTSTGTVTSDEIVDFNRFWSTRVPLRLIIRRITRCSELVPRQFSHHDNLICLVELESMERIGSSDFYYTNGTTRERNVYFNFMQV